MRQLSMMIRCALMISLIGAAACKDLMSTAELPAGTQDPKYFNTKEGAVQAFTAVKAAFQRLGIRHLVQSGLLSDEFRTSNVTLPGSVVNPLQTSIDGRILPEGVGIDQGNYDELHQLRAIASQAIGALRKYAPEQPTVMRGEVYAILGYAEIYLAELYCSGVPLSTLDYEQDFTYLPGSTTAQIFEHAVALFDTAMTLSQDSARILNFARVGKARALLGLNRTADAVQAIADVPDSFAYQYPVHWNPLGPNNTRGWDFMATVSDREGVNGLPFRSSNDPRTAVILVTGADRQIFFPKKFSTPSQRAPNVIASAVEAHLIRAEAALRTNDPSWLMTLNALRTNGTAVINGSDTTWNAGLGGQGDLEPLHDPGDSLARVTMLFAERAAWLFATGHRQGDLRRLIRQYRRRQDQVYPIGPYPGFGLYGNEVTVPIPSSEFANPHFTGCFDRNA